MDAATWLEQNGMDCAPYGARISRAMCATYQQAGDMAACRVCAAAVKGIKALPMKKTAVVGTGFRAFVDEGVAVPWSEKVAMPLPPSPAAPAFAKASAGRPCKGSAGKPCKALPVAQPRLPAPKSIERRCPPAEPYAEIEAQLLRLAGLGNAAARFLVDQIGGHHGQ